MLQSGISYNDTGKPKFFRQAGRNIARFLLPEKIENKFLGSKEDEKFLNRYNNNNVPSYAEIKYSLDNNEISRERAEELINRRYKLDILQADSEYRDVRNRNIGQGIVDIGSAAIPVGAGATVTSLGAKALRPLMGKKIGGMVTRGAAGGAIGGSIHGLGTGFVNEDVNPFIQGAIEAGAGLGLGGLGAYGLGKIAQRLDARKILNNNHLQAQYFDDYVEGLSNNSTLGKRSLLDKALANYRGLVNGAGINAGIGYFDKGNPLHEAQLQIINETNPAPDSYHTWIRTADDIHNFEDTLKPPYFDPDFIGNDFDPSYSWDMAQNAIRNGEIDIYSSYPIKEGVFVTPSPMEAQSYSGTGKIYNKRVPLADVAWIEATQGQYAPVRKNNLYENLINTQPQENIRKEIPPYKESFLYKKLQAKKKLE